MLCSSGQLPRFFGRQMALGPFEIVALEPGNAAIAVAVPHVVLSIPFDSLAASFANNRPCFLWWRWRYVARPRTNATESNDVGSDAALEAVRLIERSGDRVAVRRRGRRRVAVAGSTRWAVAASWISTGRPVREFRSP